MYGICRLTIVPLRAAPNDKAEIVSQLLFGEHYAVLEQEGEWMQVRMSYDEYVGWIDAKQHAPINADYFNYLETVELKVTTDVVSAILFKGKNLNIVMGSLLPISSSEIFRMEEQLAFNGEAKNIGKKMDASYLRSTAMKYRNSPYLWGGKSPFGIDCSGFVQQVYKICGYRLQRDASQQAMQGKQVDNLDDALEGDLVFFKNGKEHVSHVGILLDEMKIIHASGKVRVDRISNDGITDIDNNKVSHSDLCGIRRILV